MQQPNQPQVGEAAVDVAPSMVRQGDVLLVPVVEVPSGARPVARDRGRVVLAYGEVTGHAHAIRAAAARQLDLTGRRYLSVDAPVILEHEEHGPIAVAPGAYQIVIQREYVPAELDPSRARRVVD